MAVEWGLRGCGEWGTEGKRLEVGSLLCFAYALSPEDPFKMALWLQTNHSML